MLSVRSLKKLCQNNNLLATYTVLDMLMFIGATSRRTRTTAAPQGRKLTPFAFKSLIRVTVFRLPGEMPDISVVFSRQPTIYHPCAACGSHSSVHHPFCAPLTAPVPVLFF